jgi:hypothetical protein
MLVAFRDVHPGEWLLRVTRVHPAPHDAFGARNAGVQPMRRLLIFLTLAVPALLVAGCSHGGSSATRTQAATGGSRQIATAAIVSANSVPTPTQITSHVMPVLGGCPFAQPVKVTASKAIYPLDDPSYGSAQPVACYVSVEAEMADGNHAAPVGDGGCPVGQPFKVTAVNLIYGTDSPSYGQVKAVACYPSVDAAMKDGNRVPTAAITPTSAS